MRTVRMTFDGGLVQTADRVVRDLRRTRSASARDALQRAIARMRTILVLAVLGLGLPCGCRTPPDAGGAASVIGENERARYMAKIVQSPGAPCAATFLLLRRHGVGAVSVILSAYDRHSGEDGVPIRCGILSGAWHYNPGLRDSRVYQIIQRGLDDPSPKVQSDAKAWVEFTRSGQNKKTSDKPSEATP
jgi:hypothetical protein